MGDVKVNGIKLCSWCGSEGRLKVCNGKYSVVCSHTNWCEVVPWTWQYDTEEKAIATWNTRKGEAYDTVRPVKSTKDINCLMCQYFLTGNNNYPCNHCSQGRVNHFKLRFKAGEQE